MLSNLRDFAKHIGRKIFDTDAEAADNILKHIQSNNPGVDTLRVDTLYGVAKQIYGNGMKYKQIFEANREVIEDADKIYPGQKIRLPDLG